MASEPVGKLVLGQFSGGEGDNHLRGLRLIEAGLMAVECQKEPRKDPRGALVSISEGVIAGNSKCVCGS